MLTQKASSGIRTLGFAIGIAMTVSCHAESTRTLEEIRFCITSDHQAVSEPKLRLVGCGVSESIRDGYGPQVQIFLVNDDVSAMYADMALELGYNLFMDVIDPAGQSLPDSDPLPYEPYEVPLQLFPAQSIVGKQLNLACLAPGNTLVTDSAEACPAGVRFERPGEYRVIFAAQVHWCREVCGFENASMIWLHSDTIRFIKE